MLDQVLGKKVRYKMKEVLIFLFKLSVLDHNYLKTVFDKSCNINIV